MRIFKGTASGARCGSSIAAGKSCLCMTKHFPAGPSSAAESTLQAHVHSIKSAKTSISTWNAASTTRISIWRSATKLQREHLAYVEQQEHLELEAWFVLRARRPGVSVRELAAGGN